MFAKKLVSIDIGNYYTKLVVGKIRGGQIQITNAFMFKTPQDSLDDGRITKLSQLQECIMEQVPMKKLKGSSVVYSIVTPEVIIREISLPSTNSKQLAAMLSFEAEKHFPIIMNDYVIQHAVQEQVDDGKEKRSQLLVAALPKAIVEEYLALSEGLQLKPLALNIHGCGIAKLFNRAKVVNQQEFNPRLTTAVLDLGHNYLNCNIISQGKLLFNRTAFLGGRNIDMSLAYSLHISPEEAQTVKKGASLTRQGLEIGSQEDRADDRVVKGNVDEWIQEIQKIFRYYLSLKAGNKIEQIILSGGGSEIDSIDKYIEETLNRPTQVISHLEGITIDKEIMDLSLNYYLNAIGALVGD